MTNSTSQNKYKPPMPAAFSSMGSKPRYIKLKSWKVDCRLSVFDVAVFP